MKTSTWNTHPRHSMRLPVRTAPLTSVQPPRPAESRSPDWQSPDGSCQIHRDVHPAHPNAKTSRGSRGGVGLLQAGVADRSNTAAKGLAGALGGFHRFRVGFFCARGWVRSCLFVLHDQMEVDSDWWFFLETCSRPWQRARLEHSSDPSWRGTGGGELQGRSHGWNGADESALLDEILVYPAN